MAENLPIRRRWFRFSLRTFLVVSLLIGFGCAWIGMQLQQKRRHVAVVKEIVKLGGNVYFSDAEKVSAWKEWVFGSYAVQPVSLSLLNTDAADSILSQTQGMNFIYLNVNSSKVTDVAMPHQKRLTGLEYLDISHTQITDTGLTHLNGLTSLEFLDVSHTQITDAGLAHLNGLTSLECLDLSNTQITGAGLAHLNGLTSLSRLYLSSTLVTDPGLARLAGMTGLTWLYLDDTQVTQAGVEKLQQAIPGCAIYYFP